MRVLVTRPSREAQSWLQALKTAGHDPIALPLIEIAPVAEWPPLTVMHAKRSASMHECSFTLTRAWQQISRYQAIMFVSANAVDFFFAAKPQSSGSIFSQNGPSIRAWATGPGTARALLRAGASAACIDAPKFDALQFDSEALWAQVHGQVGAGSQVLIVRGIDANAQAAGSGRNWLAQRIHAAGGSTDFVAVYQRQVPLFTQAQHDLLQAGATDGSVWLFSSSQAVANLASLLPAMSWAQARAIATHPRIAQTARSCGFGVVCESRPTLDDVVASIESLA